MAVRIGQELDGWQVISQAPGTGRWWGLRDGRYALLDADGPVAEQPDWRRVQAAMARIAADGMRVSPSRTGPVVHPYDGVEPPTWSTPGRPVIVSFARHVGAPAAPRPVQLGRVRLRAIRVLRPQDVCECHDWDVL